MKKVINFFRGIYYANMVLFNLIGNILFIILMFAILICLWIVLQP